MCRFSPLFLWFISEMELLKGERANVEVGEKEVEVVC